MKILFVCHGSICRSPAAEMIFKSMNNEHEVISRALTHEEIGNDIYPPMKKELVRRFGESKKILPVFQFSKDIHEIEDPWWTGNFKKVVDQLTTCIKDIIENI